MKPTTKLIKVVGTSKKNNLGTSDRIDITFW